MSSESNKLFIGNLSFNTTEDTLEQFFSPFGEIVEVSIPINRENRRPRGFAFITYANDDGIDRAISELDGKDIDGRPIRVSRANKREN